MPNKSQKNEVLRVHLLSLSGRRKLEILEILQNISTMNVETIVIESIDDLPFDAQILFIHLEKGKEELEQQIYRKNQLKNLTPVVLVLEEKDYATLKAAIHMNVEGVVDYPWKMAAFSRAIGKNLLMVDGKKHDSVDQTLPMGKLLQLFSAPMKLKTDVQVYDYLNDYLTQFSEVEAFALLRSKDQGEILYGRLPVDIKYLKEMTNYSWQENYSGQFKVMDINDKKIIFFPLYDEDEFGLLIGAYLIPKAITDMAMNKYFQNFLQSIYHYRQVQNTAQSFESLSNIDDVTGLYNQRKLTSDLEEQIQKHTENGGTFSVMFIDVDHFKLVNDNWGHIVGSQILIDVGDALKKVLRGSDLVYRYGGDEFVVILPKINIHTVHHVAVRVLETIKAMEFDVGGDSKHRLTVSVGISEFPTDAKTSEEIIQFADEMMYLSKKSGRGKVFHVKEVSDANASGE